MEGTGHSSPVVFCAGANWSVATNPVSVLTKVSIELVSKK